ncbi:MAG: SAM-dependent DNA methyltransferase [Nitrospira sp.]|nr:SAM-dependent DNA methyltransferase [bacterium]MBL7049442.1 SAM-dependent DNA methyltransferase [Nitrospira sp.]
MSISTTIKSIQDIMRQDAGVDGDAQRISQLVWMIFLKIFDDKELEYELMDGKYKSPIPEKLRWRNWAKDAEGITGDELLEFINNNLFKTLKNLAIDEYSDRKGFIVKEVFEDAYNYMKSGTLIRQIANKINEIDFNKSEDRHIFNDLYEKILKDLQSAGNAGEYYTPRGVTRFMADMVDLKLGDTVLDPACGTGGFLTCAIENLRDQVSSVEDREILQNSIRGFEKKPLPHLLAITNMILHDIELPNIRRDNSLARPVRDISPKDRVDVILTNPPFGGTEEPGIEANFPSTFRTKETADLFLVLVTHMLKPGGRAAIVLPDGFLFGEGVKTRIKEKLMTDCNLHTIVRLPNGVFSPYTNINTNLLFLTKGEPTKEIWYFEHPLPKGYKNYSKTKPIRIEEFDLEKEWWDKREVSQNAWKVTIDEIKAKSYNLDIKNPHVLEELNADPEEMLEKYQGLLSKIATTRDALKKELMDSLENK